jgi:ribosomal-protein-alanine N-acetyltransferase
VRKYLWDDQIIDLKQTQDILLTNEDYFNKNNWGLWKITLNQQAEYVGFVGLWFFFEEPQPQLLYGLLPQWSKQGYATEAAKVITDYAFKELNFTYLLAACNAPHLVSRKVCERLHMQVVTEKEVDGKATAFYRLDAAKS